MESSKPVSSDICFSPRDSGQLHRTLKGQPGPLPSLPRCQRLGKLCRLPQSRLPGTWGQAHPLCGASGGGRTLGAPATAPPPSAVYPREGGLGLATSRHLSHVDMWLTYLVIPVENHRNSSRLSSLPCVVLYTSSPLTRHEPGLKILLG